MDKPTNHEQKSKGVPSDKAIKKFLKSQIKVSKLRAEYSELQSRIAQADAKRLQAMGIIAQMTRPPQSKDDAEGVQPKAENKDNE